MKRIVFPSLLVILILALSCALADTEKIDVSPTHTEYLYTDIHSVETGYTFVDAFIVQYIHDSEYGDMLVAGASISVDYDQVESNPVLFWNLYINGEKMAELPVFSELPNAHSSRKDINYCANISFEGVIYHAIIVPVGNDQQELEKESIIIIDDSSDHDRLNINIAESKQAGDLYDAFGFVTDDVYRNPFLGFDIIWPDAEYKLPPKDAEDKLIAQFENSGEYMVLMMLKDAKDDELSITLYHKTEDEKVEPAILNREDDFKATLLDRQLLLLNSDEKNLPILPGKIQQIEILGKPAYWIPVDYMWWGNRMHTIYIQMDQENYRVLITAQSFQNIELDDVLATIKIF